jgi:adenylate cyclase
MARAVEAAGGRVDKFIGDGVMALFGIASGPEAACRAALTAARTMSERLDELNRSLGGELDNPLRIGIGIHVGPAIVGEMGYGGAAAITAIGDAVNTASRLENLTKTYGCQLVLSEETALRAAVDLGGFPRYEIEIRGKREMLAIRTLASAGDLPAARPNPLHLVEHAADGELIL